MNKWDVRKIGEIAKVISGYAFKSSDFSDTEGIPVIKIANIGNGSVKFDNSTQYVNEKFLDSLDKKYVVINGDVLVSLTGSQITQPNSMVGRAAMYRQNDYALLNQRAGKVMGIKNKGINGFIYYTLRTPWIREYIGVIAHGAANQANISPKSIENIKTLIPPISTQQKVVDILSTYDELIENNNRRIELLEKAAHEIYKEWFIRMRFPGHENRKYNLGIPEGWEIVKLGTVVQFKRGKTITEADTGIGKIPVVAGGLKPSCYHNVANTTGPVITVSASGANAGYTNFYYEDIWASDCSYLDTNSTDSIYYYYELLKTKQDIVTNMQVGSAQPHVYPKDLNRLSIVCPEDNLIELANKQLETFHETIKMLINKNKNLMKQRDLLLPRLMSGKLVVK